MPRKNEQLSTNKAWEFLLNKYSIINEIKTKGSFIIKASQIKEVREPRLMTKWDSTDSLPKILKDNKINVLPNSRSSYIISDFDLYQKIPELTESVIKMEHVDIPPYESIDITNINSEANAINVLIISGILDKFLSSEDYVATFNGRMGTGVFDFVVNTYSGIKRSVHVQNAQCEIDGGFENDDSIVIMEAKNVVHEDFHVRQLYYPYRLWQTKVRKPIRLVFSIYSNMIYRLFEYRFQEIGDYSSIKLLNSRNYSLQDTSITMDDLIDVRRNTRVLTDDNMDSTTVPFIQANSMDRIVSLLENMYDNPMTDQQIAELMDFEPRQSGYYYNAGKYLGLFEKYSDDKQIVASLTRQGINVFKLNYKERQLKLVELILQHEIFAYFFDLTNSCGEIPDIGTIASKMKELNVCNDGVMTRRASSVQGWLKWIFNLKNL